MSWFNNIFGGEDGRKEPLPVKTAPVAPEAIARAETALRTKLPPSIARMYATADGLRAKDRTRDQVFRLMPLEEVVQLHGTLAKGANGPIYERHSLICFWTDDQANYAGVYAGGIFEGRVFYLDHDGAFAGDQSPLFRSVASFQAKLDEAAERNRMVTYFEEGEITHDDLTAHVSRFEWYRYLAPADRSTWIELPADYRSAPAHYADSDRAAYEACRDMVESKATLNEGEREFLVCSFGRLVPPDQAHLLLPFLKEDHPWLPGRVAQILVQQECPEAIGPIVTLALRGNFNCRSTARDSLAKMSVLVPQARGAIKAEYSRQGGDYAEIQNTLDAFQCSPALFYRW